MTKKEEILQGLNEKQLEAATTINGKVFLSAVPGAGKTFTIVRRAAYMIESGINPSEIVMFTFTKKAAQEMEARVRSFIGQKAKGMTVCTYHSFCVKILRKYANAIGFKNRFSIYDEEEKKNVMKDIIKEMCSKEETVNVLLKGVKVDQVASIISDLKSDMQSPEEALNNASSDFNHVVARIYKAYNNKMRECNAVDFDDMLYLVIRIFENCPDVLAAVNKKYKYLIADEAQDSAVRDLRLIKLLAGPDPDKWNLCMVGDTDQSIMGFRGASISSTTHFVLSNNFKVINMGQNYRSTKVIVNAAKSVIINNSNSLRTDAFTDNADGDNVTVCTVENDESEAMYVVSIIKALKRNGYTNDDIAILYRTARQTRKIEEALLRNKIPYKVIKGTPFYGRKEVKDMMAYVRLVLNQDDQEAFRRVANVPKRNIGEKSAETILKYHLEHDGEDLIDACHNAKISNIKSREGIANFVAVLEQLCDIAQAIDDNGDNQMTMRDLILAVINLTKYTDYLAEQEKNKETLEHRKGNIRELLNIAEQYTDIEDFVVSMAGMDVEDEEDEQGQATVKLITMHSSKGLEWPVVIIIDANDGIVPFSLALQEGNLDEERRLWYVAMTRAKQQLFILRPKFNRSARGFMYPARESRFIAEINSKYISRR